MELPRLLTRGELARILRVSPRTLDRRRCGGMILEPLQGPGQPRWLEDEVFAWVRAGRPDAKIWKSQRSRNR